METAGSQGETAEQCIGEVLDPFLCEFWPCVWERVYGKFGNKLDEKLWGQVLSYVCEKLREISAGSWDNSSSRSNSKSALTLSSGLESLDRLLTKHLSISY